MRTSLLWALGLVSLVALALPIDRGIIEMESTNSTYSDGGQAALTYLADGGAATTAMVVRGQGATRLRPATCTGGSCTRAVPDAGGAEGVAMEDIVACRLSVCAPQTDQTLSGAGEVEAWTEDPVTGLFSHMDEADWSVTVSGERCQAWPVMKNSMAAASVRLIPRPNAITVSGADGGSLITSFQCCKRGSVPLGSSGASGCGP